MNRIMDTIKINQHIPDCPQKHHGCRHMDFLVDDRNNDRQKPIIQNGKVITSWGTNKLSSFVSLKLDLIQDPQNGIFLVRPKKQAHHQTLVIIQVLLFFLTQSTPFLYSWKNATSCGPPKQLTLIRQLASNAPA